MGALDIFASCYRQRRGESSPTLRLSDRGRPAQAHPGIDHDTAVGKREHRVQVYLGHSGMLLAEAREPVRQVDQGSFVGGGATKTSNETTRLPLSDELLGVDVGQWRDAEVASPINSASTPPGPKPTSGPKTGSWTSPASSSVPPLSIGCTITPPPILAAAERMPSSS